MPFHRSRKHWSIATIVVCACAAAPLAAGCATASPTPAADAAGTPARPRRGLDRDAAVARAREDAALQYADVAVLHIGAQQRNGFWIVELTTASGGGLRYAISSTDGSIRGRDRFQ